MRTARRCSGSSLKSDPEFRKSKLEIRIGKNLVSTQYLSEPDWIVSNFEYRLSNFDNQQSTTGITTIKKAYPKENLAM